MNAETCIRVCGVKKRFARTLRRSLLYGSLDIARDLVGLSPPLQPDLRPHEFWGLSDINIEVERGERVGLIGANGSGKSTLLKLLNGIYLPDVGTIEIEGRVGALIEVGAGFHPQLTGRENIYINGAILGMSRKDIKSQYDSIVDFSGLADAMETPVAYYSSGMYVRLGFSIAMHSSPDILLIDEVLAVGDEAFKAKCINAIGEILRRNNAAMVFVSHNMHLVAGICDRVVLLEDGRLSYDGEPSGAISRYRKALLGEDRSGPRCYTRSDVRGSGRVWITEIRYLDADNEAISCLDAGAPLVLEVTCEAETAFEDVDLDLVMMNEAGSVLYQSSNRMQRTSLPLPQGRGMIKIGFPVFVLNEPRILLYLTLWNHDRTEMLDWRRELPLPVTPHRASTGAVYVRTTWTVQGAEISGTGSVR